MTAARFGFFLACLILFAMGLAAQDTTVVLLRHAERQSIFDGDSPLAEVGRRRAEGLVSVLAGYHPAALYTSDLKRTQQTLAPTAASSAWFPSSGRRLAARPWRQRSSGTCAGAPSLCAGTTT